MPDEKISKVINSDEDIPLLSEQSVISDKKGVIKSSSCKRTAFDSSLYSEESKKKSQIAKLSEFAKKVDAKLRKQTEAVWAKMTDGEKQAAFRYTIASGLDNYALRNHSYDESTDGSVKSVNPKDGWSTKHKSSVTEINNLTNAVSKARLQESMNVTRFVGYDGVAAMIANNPNDAKEKAKIIKACQEGDADTLNKIIGKGKNAIDEAFISCASCEGAGFDNNHGASVMFDMFLPKGTQALYAEPFANTNKASYNGPPPPGKDDWGKKVNWDSYKVDGKATQSPSEFGAQKELILQRGTEMKIYGVQKGSDGKLHFITDVISQPEFNN